MYPLGNSDLRCYKLASAAKCQPSHFQQALLPTPEDMGTACHHLSLAPAPTHYWKSSYYPRPPTSTVFLHNLVQTNQTGHCQVCLMMLWIIKTRLHRAHYLLLGKVEEYTVSFSDRFPSENSQNKLGYDSSNGENDLYETYFSAMSDKWSITINKQL